MRLAYDDAGHGPAVVLLHGFPLDRTMWDAQVRALSPSYRVIVPDMRGHGSSPMPEGPTSIDAMAEDVVELLDALGLTEPVVLGGLSMGGYVALAAMANHPSRFRGLILMDTRATPDSPEAAANREALAKKVLDAGSAGPVIEGMLPKLFAESTRDSRPRLIEMSRLVMAATPPKGIAGALRAMAARPDRSALLKGLTAPTLVLVGEHDAITPAEEMRGMAASAPGSTFVVVPNAGHMAPVEAPEDCNAAILSYLNQLSS